MKDNHEALLDLFLYTTHFLCIFCIYYQIWYCKLAQGWRTKQRENSLDICKFTQEVDSKRADWTWQHICGWWWQSRNVTQPHPVDTGCYVCMSVIKVFCFFLMSVVVYPLTEPAWIFRRTYGGKSPAWVAEAFPKVLQSFLPTIDSKNVYNAHKVATVRPVNDMNSIFAVGEQSTMMLMEFLQFWVRSGFFPRAVHLLEGNPFTWALSWCLWLIWPTVCSIYCCLTCRLLQ